MVSYGKRLEKLRGEKSQSEVARDIGLSPSAIGMYETERRIPRDSIKVKLAQYYGTTVQAIFYDDAT
ncbi:MAG: helix-turn-helix transcriptional regulator [Clostridiales bacterium]|nr:helix-turn-helix transcriptional regulator [Clostridiales bacterium]